MNTPRAPRPSLLRLITVTLIAALLWGCGGTPKAPPTIAEIRFQADANLNANAMGQPAPLVVRVYELAASGSFNDSDFFALFDQDQATLGADQLAREEIRLIPSAERRFEKTLQPGTRFLGIMAAYREIDQVTWRDLVAVKAGTVNRFSVHLGEKELSVTKK